jgi:hypothetical protein
MRPVRKPKSGKITYHKDGTVTIWDGKQWVRGCNVPDNVLNKLKKAERRRVWIHTEGED